jgi:predicted ArsR family transcriptional regulator
MVETPTNDDSIVHRALADPSRRRIVAELGDRPEGLDTHELSDRTLLSPNTVRFHLGVLGDAGLVTGDAAPRATPGRPRIVYTLTPAATSERRRSDEYRLLASILGGALALGDDAAGRAEAAGREWGRYLVDRPLPLAEVSADDAAETVAALLGAQGFEPERDGTTISMHRCPFYDLAESHPEVICSAHRGLVSGALDEIGGGLEVDELEIFPQPDVCVLRLRVRA